MKILVIGSGAREHALVWKISQSPLVKKIFCAPGNVGISKLAECVDLSADNIKGLLGWALKEKIDLTVVGPESPLSLGIVDEFERAGLAIFGPRKNAAILEASKCFTKEFCTQYDIPTAPYTFFYNATDAKAVLENRKDYPVVIKADGLAQGKGVIIAHNKKEAFKAVDSMLVHEKFGEAGKKIIVEDFMPGEEATFLALVDGLHFLPFESSQDHKRIFDDDKGPNTGGMGAYSPASLVTPAVYKKVVDQIIKPLLHGMNQEGRPYKGILYAGLMINKGEPRLVEFNCRLGDPEAEVVLFRLKTDLVPLMLAAIESRLENEKIEFTPHPAACVVLTSKGYPGEYEKGKTITGLDEEMEQTYVFHAGTRKDGNKITTSGGRVLAVTAQGKNLQAALDKAYKRVKQIKFEGMHYRKDIGKRGL
ncbi:MAG TPA: phosphoribosylamine--glycine ligase [Deltaproteobacteria bacterium]|nr:MAG: phosphoribosylamine--glycine ligase [Deltaproteobacteria bacterium GWA2_45_12]HBF13872.1 phosphoribosylamine--glycine ligase [Deltaproteobacteria bacterium]